VKLPQLHAHCAGHSGEIPGFPKREEEMAEVLLKIRSVKHACALSRSELYRRMRVGDFPKPVAIGLRAVAWRQSEVNAWIESRRPKSHGGAE
jgi:prophage regulatory protein